MSEPAPSEAGRLVARFFGWLLACIGILIAGLSGLCSLVALTLVTQIGLENILGFGGVPFTIGALIAAGGVAILRSTRRPPKPTLPPASFSESD